jgi:nucleoside-diphosphate-sugar epimerase
MRFRPFQRRPVSVVTGGAGFVGSHLVLELVERGQKVVIIDDLSTGEVRNLGPAIASGGAIFLHADVAVAAWKLRELLERAGIDEVDSIYHLASPASPAAYTAHPWETLKVNSLGTMSLIEIALEHNARMLYASSADVDTESLEDVETSAYLGGDPTGPRAGYAQSKRFGEAAMSCAIRTHGLVGRVVRLANCYGPMMNTRDGRLIPSLVGAVLERRPLPIHGTGLQSRAMTYVDDAVALMVRVMDAEYPAFRPVDSATDDERSVLEIARTLAVVAGVPFEVDYLAVRRDDAERRKPDSTVARSIGWEPQTSLEEGLKRTMEWYNSERPCFA